MQCPVCSKELDNFDGQFGAPPLSPGRCANCSVDYHSSHFLPMLLVTYALSVAGIATIGLDTIFDFLLLVIVAIVVAFSFPRIFGEEKPIATTPHSRVIGSVVIYFPIAFMAIYLLMSMQVWP